VPVGKVTPRAQELIDTTRECLDLAIDEMRPGRHLGDIGAAVQEHAEQHGFHVIRNFVGHGIGRRMHEDPQVYNYGRRGRGLELRAGMVLAVEPMLCEIGSKLRSLIERQAGMEPLKTCGPTTIVDGPDDRRNAGRAFRAFDATRPISVR
jgi:methionine aminopeptidase